MKKNILIFFTVFLITISNGKFGFTADDQATASDRKKTLILCRVSEKPQKHYKQLKPILDYAVSKLGHLGITQGKIQFAKNNRQVVNFLKQGKIDWITETPFSTAIFEKKAGAEIILLRWKKGGSKYHTLFITRKDSGISTLKDLSGKKIAFEDRGSASSFLLPVSTMMQSGLDVIELARA